VATADQALKWVEKLHTVLTNRRPEVEKQFDYFEGRQPLVYATDQWKTFHQNRYRNFADNWCGVVGRAPVDRQRIDGFRLGGPTDVLTADEKLLWSDWNRNELGAQSNQGFLASSIAKRSAVIVWSNDDEEPDVSWEHPSQVAVAYSQDGRQTRLAALKAWTEDDVEYATLYLPHELWKFQRPSSVQFTGGRTGSGLHVSASFSGRPWFPREVSGETWPLPNPLGEVPVVEWRNRPMLGGEPISDISGTMAMQDAINTLWAYLFNAADHASMPARVVTGAEPPKVPILDADGQVIGQRAAKMQDLAEGRFLFLPGGANGQPVGISQWDAARLDVFTAVISQAVGHIAAQTSTPGHYLLTNEKFANLNGDALTAAEVPLATKVANQQTHYTPAAKETMRLMALVRDKRGLADSIRATDGRQFVQWKDPATHSLGQVADAATKDKAVGLSLRTILERRYGMTEPEIERELQRVRDEKADPMMQAILDGVNRDNAAFGG
jgi:hypothetical protein